MIAILRDEPERRAFEDIILFGRCAISVVGLVECAIVLRGVGAVETRLDELVSRLRVETVPVDLAQGALAREAHRRFGKGTGHPAKLNFGDCFAYALAKTSGRPLLFKGADFALTDIEPAVNAGFSPTR
ncbi:MAG: type II toxin-antitoxin system VapC family toxin [Tagaea sp.]